MRERAAVVAAPSQHCDLSGTKCLVTHWSLILCVIVLVTTARLSFAADASPQKNVLVLYSFTDRRAKDDLEILKSTTRTHVGMPVDFHVEYLGSARFDALGYEKAVTGSPVSVYGGRKIYPVMAVFYPALRFAVDHLQELFPGSPIAFSSVPHRRLEGQKIGPGVTGVTMGVQAISDEEAQPVIGTYEIVSTIAQQFPTYCFVNRCFGQGVIGGSYPDPVEQETDAGELAAWILSGETPENSPVVDGPPALLHVDWRLRRWGIPASVLPPGAIIYRQATARVSYEKYVGIVVLLILVQATLIIGLLRQRARNRKADLRLRESEQRFRLMADTTPSLVWMCDRNGDITYLNDRRIDFTGRDLATGLGDTWSAFVHPDDLESVLTSNKQALEDQREFSKEYRLRRRDGVYRWMLDIAAPRVNGDGSFAGFIGSAVDITDQKLAQEALERIGGKLIEAQEEERSRIARELHDDICQRLALLSMELEQANRESNRSSGSPKIEEIRRHCAQIAGDVQALSHKLHSSKLEYLGLAPAIRSYCQEFARQHEVTVPFADENVPSFLPRDISLSLFRVAQEALQNALKHSGARQFSVSLQGLANEIQLEVSDRGAGFDVEGAKLDRGLGLVSMQERVHLVHGSFTIESTMNGGTRILVRVPLPGEMKASTTDAESA